MPTLLVARVGTGNRSKGSGLLGWDTHTRALTLYLLGHSTPLSPCPPFTGPLRLSWPYMEPPTLRNLYKRKVNQLVSIFSATDSVLREGQQMGGGSHFYHSAGTGAHNSHGEPTPRPGFPHCTSATAAWGGSCFPGSSR